jgi:ABC-type antimicrobial peptide transport system permease subunit
MVTPRNDVRENLLLALDTLWAHKFRSLLTILGVLIGTATVIGVASIFKGLDQQVVDIARDFGVRTIYIYKFQPGMRFRLSREERMRKPLAFEDAQALREHCPSVDEVAVQILQWGPPQVAKYKGQEMVDGILRGVTPEAFSVLNAELQDGRFLTRVDDLHRRNVVVLGADVTKRFFEGQDPIGKTILVDGHNFEVIGTMAKRKEFLGDNGNDRLLLIPYWTYKKLYPYAKEHFIMASAREGRVQELVDEVTGVLRRVRGDKLSDPDSFGIATAESIITQFREIMATVVIVTVVISSIGLLVGGIGVMNIMLVSVTERTREIGVRKAIGARRSDIQWQFLLEAMTLTGVGGILGIAAGWTISLLVRTFVPGLPSTVPLWSVIAGFLVAVGIGLFFGMWPALKAARLDPIVALRHE